MLSKTPIEIHNISVVDFELQKDTLTFSTLESNLNNMFTMNGLLLFLSKNTHCKELTS